MKSSRSAKIGFWGYVPEDIINSYKEKYDNPTFIDLDIEIGAPETKIIPDSSCKIIKNIIDNSIYLKNELIEIIAPIGKDKCDNAYFASQILKENGLKINEFEYLEKSQKQEIKICKSNLPLRQKVELLTENIVEKKEIKMVECEPKFGFWGVPPNDLSILELFPDETHVFGWLRCVEAGCPANIELEMQVDKDLPTIFYAQTFCSKCQIAKYLANKYNGLYIDVDGYSNSSIKAKIEAFLTLR